MAGLGVMRGSGGTRALLSAVAGSMILERAFEPITAHPDRDGAVSERLLGTLARLAAVVQRPEDRAAITRVAEFVCSAATHQ